MRPLRAARRFLPKGVSPHESVDHARTRRRRPDQRQLELARRLHADRLDARQRRLPGGESAPGEDDVHRDGRRRGVPVLQLAPAARAGSRLPGAAGGHGDRGHHALALRRDRAVQGDVLVGGRRAADRARRADRLGVPGRDVRGGRGGRRARRRRRRRGRVARVHQPDAARVQPPAGAAARRGPRAARAAVARARRLLLGDEDRGRTSVAGSATCWSRSASSC